MKILSDFDGVLTHLESEGKRVHQIFRELLLQYGNTTTHHDLVDRWMAKADQEMEKHPQNHGWKINSRISAFSNEDSFIHMNGLAACLDQWTELERELQEVVKNLQKHDFKNFQMVAQKAYYQMTDETRSGQIQPLDPSTAKVFSRLLEKGAKIVIVSNSGTDRIMDLLSRAGISASTHAENPNAKLRVRGDAQKFMIDHPSRTFEVGKYRIETQRPNYQKIIQEEQPNVVIGDVFSLDLALPLYLTRTQPELYKGMQLFLRLQNYTPQWSKEFIQKSEEKNAKLSLLKTLEDLVSVVDVV